MKNIDVIIVSASLIGFIVYMLITTHQISSLEAQISSLTKENEKCIGRVASDKKIQQSIGRIVSRRCADVYEPQPIR